MKHPRPRTGTHRASRTPAVRIVAALAAGVLVFGGCRSETVPEAYAPTDDHAGYTESLGKANLQDTALGRDWISAATAALSAPVSLELPYTESVYFDPTRPNALGLRFRVEQGQRLEVEATRGVSGDFRLFMDLFREDPEDSPHIASGSVDEDRLQVDVRKPGTYVLRLQPELLRGGTLIVRVRTGPSLAFPVRGVGTEAIIGWFGDPRDGGARLHEGLDILAPRGTEVLAPADGFVRRVGTNTLGGNIVWMVDDARGASYYFAHLDTQLVENGVSVTTGDTIGTVGNTGNAATTPPHLHFGVYATDGFRRRSVDPYHYLFDSGKRPAEISADPALLGEWFRTDSESVPFSLIGSLTAETIAALPRNTVVRAVGASGPRYRVRLPVGIEGYIESSEIVPLEGPLATITVAHPTALRDRPEAIASIIATAGVGHQLALLGEFDRFGLVRTEAGLGGWIRLP